MGLSIGKCKEIFRKSEEDLKAEDQGQQKKIRDRFGGRKVAVGGQKFESINNQQHKTRVVED